MSQPHSNTESLAAHDAEIALLDLLLDRTTRAHALEIAIVAHALVDPAALADCRELPVSPACAWLLTLVIEDNVAARAALVATARIGLQLPSAIGELPVRFCRDVIALASMVASIRVGDLASVGTLGHMMDLLGSVRQDEQVRLAA